MSRSKLILVDGHSLAYRAFYALPVDMQTSTGELTNATYGFTSMLFTVLNEETPQYIIVTFDKGPSFRTREYAEYKAHREKMPDEMRGQMDRIKEIIAALGIPIVDMEDYEADDLLGTLSQKATKAGLDVVIVTGDRDALQLVDEHITVLTSGRRFSDTRHYTPDAVQEKYGGLTPNQLIDLKALMGDKSDNIPGVKGVGEKGAINLLTKYGSLDSIYEHIDELTSRYQKALKAQRTEAYLSQKLGRIVRDAPVDLDLQAAAVKKGYDQQHLLELLQHLEFRSLVNRLPVWATPTDTQQGQLTFFGTDADSRSDSEAKPSPNTQTHLITTEADLAALVQTLQAVKALTIDTETTDVDAMLAQLVGIALTDREGEAWYIPIRAPEDDPTLPLETVTQHLEPLLSNPGLTKQGHNLKYDLKILARHGIPSSGHPLPGPYFDSMVAEWLLNPGSHNLGLKDQAWARLGIQMTEISELIGSGKSQTTMDTVPLAQVLPYAGADADMTQRLVNVLKSELAQLHKETVEILDHKDTELDLFYDLEMPLLPILTDMEMTGVKLDVEWLTTLSDELEQRVTDLEQTIFEQAGTEFNVNSTQQLSEVLFERLDLPTRGVRKTKTGHYSTRAAVLENLKGKHPIIGHILTLRELSKLKSTYVDALPELVNPETGRVHTSYNQTGTVTGRLSSANPNLQNIPIRTEEGRRVRRAFIAEDGWQLVGADYSQVELRVMAHISEDPGLIEAFSRGEDIHATTAAAVYNVSLDEVTYEMRRVAKAVNFGLIYGQSAYGLARQIDVKPSEAEEFIQRYFERFPKVQVYMDQIEKEVKEQGYVETLFHRRRYFSELTKKSRASKRRRKAALRMAINAPIQGTAADILKLAMLRMDRALKENDLRTRPILQVHDELVFEVPDAEVNTAIPIIREAMEGACTLKVPLKVDVEAGPNWEEMTEI